MSLYPGSNFGLFGFGGYGFGGLQIAQTPPADLPPATPEEKAEPVDPIDRTLSFYNVAAGRGWFPGFDKAPPPGWQTWWMMRRYATIVFAHMLVTAPILAGTQSVEVVNKGDTEAEGWKDDAEADLLPPLADALPAALECLHFGSWLQEIAWERRGGRIAPAFNPLLPGEAVLYRDAYRRFAGYKVMQEERDARYGFLCVNEPHIDPIFGYSRNENCREEWWRARESSKNADRVENKASGIQMKIGLPMGQSFTDSNGNQMLGNDAIQAIVNAAITGQTFKVPLCPFRKEDIIKNPELAKIEAVTTEPFDWKDNAPAVMAHLARLGALNVDIVRAWHRPEREGMQGQHGTQAEAGTHGQVGITDSELVAGMVLRQYTRQVVDRWAVTNKGPGAIGRLRVVQNPLSDPQQEFRQKLSLAMVQDTQTGPDSILVIDKRALLGGCEVPLLSEDDVAAAKADADAKQAEKDKAKADQLQQMQQNPPPGNNGSGDVMPKIAASGNGNGHGKIGAVELFSRVLELGRDE